ncbi:MAG: redox-sensing transcriptional repressor Rex [Oscillospiraceae bacterium]
MARYNNVSLSVVRRLPRYYRFLEDLLNRGVHRISSREMAQKMGLTASQIRQDLNCFGGFGQQGYGYNIDALYSEIGKILGLDQNMKCIVIGVGNLGTAITRHIPYESLGFNLIGAFDISPSVVGKEVRGITVKHTSEIESFCKLHHPKAAVLCIPKEPALEIAKQLVECGVFGFWNFAHVDLATSFDDVVVQDVYLGDSLMTLSYLMNEFENEHNPDKGV